MIHEEEDKECYESPAHNVVDQCKEGHAKLYLGVHLRDHCHLTAIAYKHLIIILLGYFAFFKSTHLSILQFLISESNISWCYRHKLHTKGKHHEDDQNADDTESLWHCVLAPYPIYLKAEKVNPYLDDAVKDADESVQQNNSKNDAIKEKLDAIETFVDGGQHSQEEVEWIEEAGALVEQEATLHAAFRIQKSIDIVDEHRVDDEETHGQTSNANGHSKWSQKLQ